MGLEQIDDRLTVLIAHASCCVAEQGLGIPVSCNGTARCNSLVFTASCALARGCCCSGVHAGPQADTSTAATSAQVLAFGTNIKEQYGLKHVFAWHATMGYWSGVSPAAAAVDAATAAAAQAHARDPDAGSAAARAAADATVVLPRVGPVMSDLEPPTDWSQLVRTGAPQHTIDVASVVRNMLGKLWTICHMQHGLTHAMPVCALTCHSTCKTNHCYAVFLLTKAFCTFTGLLRVQVLGGIGTPQDPRKFFFHLHSQLASLGITGMVGCCLL